MRTTAKWIGIAGIVAAFGLGRAALGDIPVPPPIGQRAVPVTMTVEFGPLADRIGERRVVAAKETLRSIARSYSTDPAAWKVLAAANRATVPDPDRLKVGDVLYVPARLKQPAPPPGTVIPASAPGSEYLAVWVTSGRRGKTEHVYVGKGTKMPEALGGGGALFLVPAEHAGALAKLADGAERPAGTVAAIPGAVTGALASVLPYVPETSSTKQIEVVHRLKGIEGTRLVVESETLNHGAKDGADDGILVRADSRPSRSREGEPRIPIAKTDVPKSPPFETIGGSPPVPAEDEGRFAPSTALLVAVGGLLVLFFAWGLRRKPEVPPDA